MGSYTGLYVKRLSNGKIESVQIADQNGNSQRLDHEIYIQRQLKPPIEKLPDIKDYMAAASGQGISPIVFALVNWLRGETVSDEALYRMQQFGFVHPDLDGNLQITPSGEQALHDHHLE